MLEFSHVTKRFRGQGPPGEGDGAAPGSAARAGRRPALDDVSFTVARGEVFGLLGHNGAGKSTALGVMLGLVYADAGEVRIDGVSVQRERERALRKVGAIFESPRFFEYQTGWQNLKILTGYSGYWDEREVRETVEMVGLGNRIESKVSTYSHGMRQRLALAQALLPRPQLLLLDEPTDGLDPDGVIDFRERIKWLGAEFGVTMLLNSHLLSEVEQICSRVAILREGRVVYDGRTSGIESEEQIYRLETDNWDAAQRIAEGVGARSPATGKIALSKTADVAEVVAALVGAGVKVRGVTLEEESLEQLYLRVSHGGTGTGRRA